MTPPPPGNVDPSAVDVCPLRGRRSPLVLIASESEAVRRLTLHHRQLGRSDGGIARSDRPSYERAQRRQGSARFARRADDTDRATLTTPPRARWMAIVGANRNHEREHEQNARNDMSDHHSQALTEHAVAKQLGLSVATLRAWQLKGKGPRFVCFGRAVRYLAADIEHFIEASVVDQSGHAGDSNL